MYLPPNASRKRLREAENARRNRQEAIRAWSQGQLGRRDLLRLGLMTASGLWVLKNGLSPFAKSAYAATGTGTVPSPIPPGLEFTQPMPRLEELPRKPLGQLDAAYPAPRRESSQKLVPVMGTMGPCEGRPPGPLWAHQRWEQFYPRVCVEVSQRPVVPGQLFHPQLPEIHPDRFWTFEGTVPFKLVKARYGEPMLFRHHNRLSENVAANGGFGRHTITTHFHNGHTPAESDGFAGAFFYPGQYYDYRWAHALAGTDTINMDASDARAGGPDDGDGIVKVPGDWRETQSTMWFHDHMIDFTSQNVYKGNASMLNLYSSVDRGREDLDDGVNLRLPSGTAQPWGNTDYDVNLMLADKALDADGQMTFDIFNFDGFIGDMMTVNAAYKPYLEVERRKYRFRILNASVSHFFKLCLSDGSKFWWIANDGNLLTKPLLVNQLDEQGIAERYDIVVDFSQYAIGTKLHLVNLCEHTDGKGPSRDLPLADALAGLSPDRIVGRVLEFRVARDPAKADVSQVPAQLIPLPDRKPVVRERTFEFGRGGSSDSSPWTIKVNGGQSLGAEVGRISAAPRPGTAEIWHLVNGGGGWDHPVHIHFEEAQTLLRNGVTPPDWERFGRKDVWRLRPSGRVTLYIQFREFSGTYVEHCHNTVHEDHAMLLRYDVNGGPTPLPTPIPSPTGVTFLPSDVLPEGA
jgi:FtsP/CotA-like multicopper oxidase with cupredoxin domain